MLEELYNWLESYSGTSYDFSESFKEIDGDQAFLNPADWHYGMSFILKQLQDAPTCRSRCSFRERKPHEGLLQG